MLALCSLRPLTLNSHSGNRTMANTAQLTANAPVLKRSAKGELIIQTPVTQKFQVENVQGGMSLYIEATGLQKNFRILFDAHSYDVIHVGRPFPFNGARCCYVYVNPVDNTTPSNLPTAAEPVFDPEKFYSEPNVLNGSKKVKGKKARGYIMGKSATSVLKWMGREGYSFGQAMIVAEKLIDGNGKIARTSVQTAWADGQNPKYASGAANITDAQKHQIDVVCKGAKVSTEQPAPAKTDNELIAQLEERIAAQNDFIADLETRIEAARPVVIQIKQADKPTIELKEKTHPIFEQVLFHINCGDNVMLVGPRGCGKTHIASQVAQGLDRPHGAISLSGGVTESKLFGRVTPNITTGKQEYQMTPFVELYETGGVFLLDEVDAADPNVLLSLNLGLSNRHIIVDRPKKPSIQQHKEFVCMAAANTWGNGADRQYVGRNQQDSAFTERFVQISMDYDMELELALCGDQADLVRKLHNYRSAIRSNRLERTLSTRFILRAANWVRNGQSLAYVEKMLFAGWRDDEIRKVSGT